MYVSNKCINFISNNTFISIPILHMRKWRHWGNSSLAQCHTASKWRKYKHFQYVSVSPGKSLYISHLLRNGSAPKISTYLPSTDRLYCRSPAPEAKETSYSLRALWPCCCLRAALHRTMGISAVPLLHWALSPIFFFFLSIMTLLRDAKGILLCSLCIEAFQFFT